MTDTFTIPPEAIEAAFQAWCRVMAAPEVGPAMTEAIAAALEAWPGMQGGWYNDRNFATAIILPLPKEPSHG